MTTKTQSAETRANRLDVLSRLADDLAHEVKNPLHSLVINIELLRRRIAGGHVESALERCDVLEEEVQRLHGLVDGILRLFRPSRDDAGITEVDLTLAEITPLLERQARLAGVAWHYEPPPRGARAAIRPAALVQAVLNLVVNALDTLGEAGGHIELGVSMGGDHIAIGVRDTGRGLDGEVDGSAPSATRDLGLPVTRALVEEAGGRLEVERPEDGGGRRFVIVLPRYRSA